MTAEDLQKKMFQIQQLCEELQSELGEVDAPNFDSLRSEIDDAEQEWESNDYESAISTLRDVADQITDDCDSVGGLEERESILEWIDQMPTASFQHFT